MLIGFLQVWAVRHTMGLGSYTRALASAFINIGSKFVIAFHRGIFGCSRLSSLHCESFLGLEHRRPRLLVGLMLVLMHWRGSSRREGRE